MDRGPGKAAADLRLIPENIARTLLNEAARSAAERSYGRGIASRGPASPDALNVPGEIGLNGTVTRYAQFDIDRFDDSEFG